MTGIVAIAFGVVILTLVMWLLLTRRLREKYAILWLVIGVAVLMLGLFPGLLRWATRVVGVQVPANLLFALAIVLLLAVTLHLSWELSQAEEEIRRTAEEAAISRAQYEQIAARVAELERERGTGERPPRSEPPPTPPASPPLGA